MAMRKNNIQMTTTVERLKLLDAVRTNYERHKQIVEEAWAGYWKRAEEELARRLAAVREGKEPDIVIRLDRPVDHTEVYENSIAMLEWSTDEFVVLEADEFRQLVRDQWEFTDHFYATNSGYSATARAHQPRKR